MNKNKMKLLEIDPLELARQLTLLESTLYKRIRPYECLQRARESKTGENKDHITDVIQLTNKVLSLTLTCLCELSKFRRLQIG